jgi:hypothetical protein
VVVESLGVVVVLELQDELVPDALSTVPLIWTLWPTCARRFSEEEISIPSGWALLVSTNLPSRSLMHPTAVSFFPAVLDEVDEVLLWVELPDDDDVLFCDCAATPKQQTSGKIARVMRFILFKLPQI